MFGERGRKLIKRGHKREGGEGGGEREGKRERGKDHHSSFMDFYSWS